MNGRIFTEIRTHVQYQDTAVRKKNIVSVMHYLYCCATVLYCTLPDCTTAVCFSCLGVGVAFFLRGNACVSPSTIFSFF